MKKILFVLLVGLFQNLIYSATITSTSTGGAWNVGGSWVGGIVPTSADDVIIVSGSTITVVGSAGSAKTLDIRGILFFNANNTSINLPANGTIKIVSPGEVDYSTPCTNTMEINIGGNKYAACQGNGNTTHTFATLNAAGGNCPTSAGVLSGNQYICRYNTYNTMITTLSSTVSGGTWSSSNTAIASVNAITGVVTSTKPDDGISRTVTITYTVGGSGGCGVYTATREVYVANSPGQGPESISGAAVQCRNTTATYTITPDVYSNSYGWSYQGTDVTIIPAANGLSANITFGPSATSANIVVTSYNGCGTSGGGKYFYVTVEPTPSAPGTASPHSTSCTGFTAQWAYTNHATKYYLDVSTNNSFSTFVHNNLDVANVTSYALTGLNPGTTYYYRVRAYSNCGTSPNSSTMTYATTASPTTAPTVSAATGMNCTSATLNWNSIANATGYYLDIATDNGFSNFVTNYNNSYIGYYPSSGYYAGNLPSGVLYYRVRATNNCNVITGNSNTINFQTTAPLGGSVSPAQTICSGTKPTNLTLTGNASPVQNWQSATDIGFTTNVSYIAVNSTTLPSASINNLTQNTYFRAVTKMTSDPWCESYSSPVLITINNSITTGSSTPTVCVNTAMTSITHTVIGFTGIGTVTNLPTGVTPSLSGNTLTIGGIPTQSGIFNYNIQLTGGSCSSGTGNATGSITVRPAFTTGTINNTGETICSNTIPSITIGNSVAASGGDNSITYQWQYSTDNTFSSNVTTVNSNTATYNPTQTLTQTTYYRRQAKDATCSTTFTNSTNIWTVTVAGNTLSVAPTGITGTTTICNGASTTLTVSGGTVGEGGIAQWFTNSCGGVSVGTGNSITVSPTSNTIYYVRYSGTCNTTTCASQLVTVNPVSLGGNIAGSASVCSGTNSTNLTLSGHTGNVIGWESSLDNFATAGTPITDTSTSITASNLNSTTYYRAIVQSGSCTPAYSAVATITVRPTPTVTISGTTTVCEGTARNITFTNPHTEGITVTYNINGGTETSIDVPARALLNVLASVNAGTFTYNLVRVNYQIGGCPATLSGSATITVNPIPTAPTVGAITNMSCTTNTGSVVLEGLPSGTYTITNVQTGATKTDSGSSTTITGLGAGSYTFTVTNASGCPSVASSLVTIQDNSSTTWNGTSWSNGNPDANKNVIITGVATYTFSSGFIACALTIGNGVIATVPSGITLTVTNAVTVNTGGSLTFENNASLLQTANVTNNANSGVIKYKRISEPMKNFDYTYWSSPVAGQTLYNVSPNTLSDKFHSFSGVAWVAENPSNIMSPGIGYIIRSAKPNYWPNPNAVTYAQPVEFIGIPNNGNITSSQTMTAGNFYLIGNPYPSALDADEFLQVNANNDAILGGTIYFWTHNTTIRQDGSFYVYESNDYASYNLTGGVASAPTDPNHDINGSDQGKKPTGSIASGQSFFVNAEGTGKVEFTNSMRVAEQNNQFFKPGKTTKKTAIEKNRLWLNMTNSGGAFKQTLIGYIEGASNNYDAAFDGLSFDGNSFIDFYSVNATDNLTIQGRALPFNNADTVPLGFRTTIAGNFTIAIDQADGALVAQRVYLEDKLTNTINELTAKNYTFTTKTGTFNNRFVLRYTNETLGTGDFETVEENLTVSIHDKTITINSVKENIDKVFIYDITGKLLYTKQDVGNVEFVIRNLSFAQQVVLIKTFLENGTSTTKKIIFK